MTGSPDVTALLIAHRETPDLLMHEVLPLLYDEMRRLARRHRKSSPTLNTTALVHEAYLRLVDQTQLNVQDRGHFMALASRAMRFVLIDYARRRKAEKRGGGQAHHTLDDNRIAIDEQAEDLLALDEALERLAAMSERLARVVECRYFGGLSVEETAEALGSSARTVKRDWQKARLWLHRELTDMA
ncbi:MAG: ECF-type sigma factor [Bacteroidota bacterium]